MSESIQEARKVLKAAENNLARILLEHSNRPQHLQRKCGWGQHKYVQHPDFFVLICLKCGHEKDIEMDPDGR